MPYGPRVGKPGRARCGCENGALRDMAGRKSFTDMDEVENEAPNPVMKEGALHQAPILKLATASPSRSNCTSAIPRSMTATIE